MKVRKHKKCTKLAALVLAAMAMTSTAWAGVEEATEYTMDTIVVTAQRYEKKDLDIAAATDVYTNEQLRNTGARNLQQALSKVSGLLYEAKGPGGASLGTMTSKVSIRGVQNGTLILVNGTPLNLRTLYNLEDIPLENIERIEIVKGGGSVLYGSEATGGVINIIMKKEMVNSVTVGGGNFGQQNYGLTVQADKLGVSYSYDKWGDTGKVSSTLTEASTPTTKEMVNVFNGSEKNNVTLTYKFSESVDFLYGHNESISRFTYKFGKNYAAGIIDQARYYNKYDNRKDFVQLNIRDGNVKGNVYYNANSLHTTGTDYRDKDGKTDTDGGYPQPKDTKEENQTYGFDVQKIGKIDNATWLLGATYQNEQFIDKVNTTPTRDRNNYSIYGQWEDPLNDADTVTLSGRRSWTTGADEDKNYNNFSSQGQFVHKLKENESIYASVGQSYVMPTFKQMYATSGMVIGDPNLRPQTGMHYEMGWKKNHENHKWRVALFNYQIKDNISFQKKDNKYYAVNEDLKNTGLEVSADIEGNNGWSYQYGVTYSDPQAKSNSQKPGAKQYWDRNFGRLQLNGGATYQKEKWTTSLTATYLTERVLTPSDKPSFKTKPSLLTTLNVNYAVDKSSEINLSIDNILDRQDNVTHSSSAYYSTPINYLLSYKYKF
ncbi:TonB-dependent receptor plug domain-containing protein [Anaerospora hongkongensis]|uniref:TonB-dependent receptor plug domain-containing protein n=1 Tax=Anaerospora hongkongensis TaxID=244830 RepID=UPI002899140D|nr:TonB-dependent receptor [Anaerospora hongkongensis]